MMKNGHVIILDRYTRAIIMVNPGVLFAFEDNLKRVGFGGQAKEARGCLNAIGIPTKISPDKFIWDDDCEEPEFRKNIREPIIQAFGILRLHLRKGGTIVWPRDGVGTGLARLHITAPRVFNAIEGVKEEVFSEAISIQHQQLEDISK